ncbi:hypothetical protein CFC21_076593 [Triticum aestivum]|uniref:Uncharacterized protein n=5 Tax=Triticinae TaxID=1648030 RepID=A0A453K3M9_AEGTS|nr:uncharacterized protein LOC119307960 [Triticum dicoccoides]XP_044395802.1 uncharacterized protein LOC123119901 [Triticum aestivum]KAF7071208.1 hypothetical protein CFC21_076593 [Triticum aestivum]VAI28826.1 unnamed protein product [Triticum turgidum subsp. durum]
MGRSAIAKSTGLLREVKNRQSSNLTSRVQPTKARSAETALWVPHPRTGIYYPRGFEWVMEDVPSSAATFQQTYWLRSGDAETASSPTSTDGTAAFDNPFL